MYDNEKKQLDNHRAKIDQLDDQVLDAIIQRAKIVKEIAELKRSSKSNVYRPERESQMLRRLRSQNNNDLIPDDSIECIFREIISVSRQSEENLSASVLGPKGTYSEEAARKHFGNAINLSYYSTIHDIMRATESGQADFAVVPLENSIEGGVNATLDCLLSTTLSVCGEIDLPIHHNLLSTAEDISQIKTIYAHNQSLGQCRSWLLSYLPHCALVSVSSNTEATRMVQGKPDCAAIGSVASANYYSLSVLEQNIEDSVTNTTRFFVLSKRSTPPSGKDKTSLILSCYNRPGALWDLLTPLRESGVDMTKIASHPSKAGLWDYVFFIDFIGHKENPKDAELLHNLKSVAGMYKNLGSYPTNT